MSTQIQSGNVKKSHWSGDQHDSTSTDSQTARSEDVGSMIAEPDTEDYQHLHRVEDNATIPGFERDITQDLSGAGPPCSDKVLNMDPVLEIQ